jgi:hypothetical protein
MLSAAIIVSEEVEKHLFHSLHTVEGVEWNGIFSPNNNIPKQLDKALIFSSPELMPIICELLVVLNPEYCKFDFLSYAVRNGCHLFLSDKLRLNTEERKQLIHLAKEGSTYIQIQNDFLFQPFHKKIITPNNGICYIEARQSAPSEPGRLQEMILNNLLLILKATGVPIHRVDVFCGTAPSKRPDILNIHINFINGSTASLTVTFTEHQRIHLLCIYHEGGVSTFNFMQNSICEQPEKSSNAMLLETSIASLPDQIADFIKIIEKKSTPVYSLNDEIEVFLLMEKIREKFDLHSVTL